jgi:tripartite-type tricarboxylate transporter receptor subunit TctC
MNRWPSPNAARTAAATVQKLCEGITMFINDCLRSLSTICAGALVAIVVSGVSAQAFPAKPIRLIVPYSSGSATDSLARLIADKLTASLGQAVVVEDQPSANGISASAAVAKAAPDGYTLIMIAANHVVNPSLYRDVPFDPIKDFKPIIRVAFAPFILTVNPSLPVTNLKELIAYAKAHPGEVNYASPGNGSPAHLATELLKTETGMNLVHIPYKAAAQAMTDVVAGHVPVMMVVASAATPQIKAGHLRALGVTTLVRLAQLPDVPTIDEAGVKGFEMISWIGFAGPAGLPPEIVSRLSGEVTRIVQQSDTAERIAGLGLGISVMQSAPFAEYMTREQTRWEAVVRRSGARLD